MASVDLEKISKIFDKNVKAVDNVSMNVKDHEFVVLVGPSGCGKSTTLRMIAGLESVTSGRIRIGGRDVTDVAPKDRDIAMVFQNYALYPHMSVYQNLAFSLQLRKFSKKEMEERVQEAARILDITELLDRKPKALSGGQRQRVAVGRAIVRKPAVFLFDEPLSNLDAKLRVQMRAEISKLHTQLDATMIYVTHDQVEAMTMGDRIVVMNEGRIQQVDTPLHIYNKPANLFVAGFIGSPAMNFINGSISRSDGLLFQSDGFSFPIANDRIKALEAWVGKKVVLGVRPEDIRPAVETDTASFKANVQIIEPMGNELIVYLEQGRHNLVARFSPDTLVALHDKMPIVFDAEKRHFFDAETQERIETQ